MSSKPVPRPAQTDRVNAAAEWFAHGGADKTKPIIPQLRRQFSLTALEAVQALREAALQRARSI
jgi:hypothetical protein